MEEKITSLEKLNSPIILLNTALGSVLVEFGDTKVIVTASVELKKPKWMEKKTTEAG